MQFGAIAGPDTRYILKDSVEELGCIGFRQKKTKQYGVLTQRVQNGKIILNSLFSRMLRLSYEQSDQKSF